MKIVMLVATVVCACITGCAGQGEVFTPPQPLLAPYDTRAGEVTWAVVPPKNESGTTAVDVLAVGDALVAAIEEIRGVRCVPLNRSIDAMRSLKMSSVSSASDAKMLAKAMGVDAVLVSSVTAYDPYRPEFGMAAGLFARQGAMAPGKPPPAMDAKNVSRQLVDRSPDESLSFGDRAVAITSDHFDGRNHQVQMDVMTYASGRLKGQSALGWRKYLAAMPEFVGFASYRTIDSLLKQEWIRVGGDVQPADKHPDNSAHLTVTSNQLLERQVDMKGKSSYSR